MSFLLFPKIIYICTVNLKIKRYVAILMLLVMTAYSVPKELLHELHHHVDTVDAPFKAGNSREVGTKHIHCDVFNFNGPVLLSSIHFFSFSDDFVPNSFSPTFSDEYFHHVTFDNFQRGPPTV